MLFDQCIKIRRLVSLSECLLSQSMMLLLLLASFSILLIVFMKRHYKYWEKLSVVCDTPVLFFGSFFDVALRRKHVSETIRSIYSRFSKYDYVGMFIFHQPVLLLRSPELLKKILVKDFDKFTNRNIATNETADPLAFHTLFISRDNIWRNMRAKLSPVFTSGKMKLMFPLMQECAKDLHQHLTEQAGNEIEAKLLMRRYTVDIISSCAFGMHTNCFAEEEPEVLQMASRLMDFRKAVRGISVFSFFFLHSFVNIFKLTFADRTATDYFFEMFKTNLRERETNNIIRQDFVDLLRDLRKTEQITDNYKFDDDVKMAAQAIAFFSAGNDTSAITLAMALYELALHPEIQDRLREELKQYETFTYENILNMKYLDMVVNEALRKYPLAPFLNRQSDVEYTLDDGFTLPKGTSVLMPISGLHHDPEYFPDPETFDPERFSDENKDNLVPYSYLPFGDGPRHCIGKRFALLVTKLGLAITIKDFAFEVTENTPIPLDLDPGSLFTQNRGGVPLKLTRVF